jgi:hypothetical protein
MCFETVVSVALFGLSEIIQILRCAFAAAPLEKYAHRMIVYAFYNKNSKLRIFLVLWLCVEMGGSGYFLWYAAVRLEFDPSCSIVHPPSLIIVYEYV